MKIHCIKICLLFLLAGMAANTIQSQTGHRLLREADKSYEEEDFKEAELNYRKAVEKNRKKFAAKGKYNLGNSVYKQKRYEEAARHFESAAEAQKKDTQKAHALHNLGNAYFKDRKLKESIEAYKEALRLDPNDLETKNNLALAQQLLWMQQQQEKQQQQNQEENQQQDKGDRQSQSSDKQSQQQQKQQQQQQPQQDMNKQEAQRLLEIMEREEQKTLEKQRKMKGSRSKPEKDW